MQSTKSTITTPEAKADITARRKAGESFSLIGRAYGVTRQRIQKLCFDWGVPVPVIVRRTPKALLDQAVALVQEGATVKASATEAGVNEETLRVRLRELGVDVAAAVSTARSHRFDGRTFGLWTVVDGSYDPSPHHHNARSVECKCACGTIRRVVLSNLLAGSSQGCGCRTKTGGPATRRRVPWQCRETGEIVPHTKALAQHLGALYPTLMRRLNRGEPYIDSDGRTWVAQPQLAVEHKPGGPQRPWVELESGETWPSTKALAEHLGITHVRLWYVIKQGKAYASADGNHYAPVHLAGTLRRVPRGSGAVPTIWSCVETGEQWPTRKALAETLGVPPSTLASWISRSGRIVHAGRTYQYQRQQQAATATEGAA